MLRPRIIPCLLIRNNGLVKTRTFVDDKYVGDPINAVKIFNEKGVDEIMIIDIDASVKEKEPNYSLIERLANESRMPICYGGGIKNCNQAEKIIEMGIEKVAISSAFIKNPLMISDLASSVGSQSVVGVLDIKKSLFKGYKIYTHNGTRQVEGDLFHWINKFQENGIGEIVFNSITRDGMMNGYDLNLVKSVLSNICVPSTFLGGAGSLSDIRELISITGIGGCAAGSLFVFKGKYRAVLINYPRLNEKIEIIKEGLINHINKNQNL